MRHVEKLSQGQETELRTVVDAATRTSRLAHAFSYWSAHSATKKEVATAVPSTRAAVDNDDGDKHAPMPAAFSWAALTAGKVTQHPEQRTSAAADSPVVARTADSWAVIASRSPTRQQGHRPQIMMPPKSDNENTAIPEHLRREDAMEEWGQEQTTAGTGGREVVEEEDWVAVATARPNPLMRQHQHVVDAVSAPTPEELKSIQRAVSKLWELDTSRRLIPGKHYTLDLQQSTRLDDARDRACRPVRSAFGYLDACCVARRS